MSNCLIVCDGALSKKLLNRFTKLNKPRQKVTIISCDGASDFLCRHNIIPDYIVGDLDTIKQKTLAYYKQKKVTVIKNPDQYKNDLEKALDLALKKKFKNISVIGFSGKRFDHSVNNLSILKRYYRKANITVYDKDFEIFFVKRSAEFKSRKGSVVSLIPLPAAKGIKTTGLKYPLNSETLLFGKREGGLNEATENNVKIEVRSGDLLVFKKY